MTGLTTKILRVEALLSNTKGLFSPAVKMFTFEAKIPVRNQVSNSSLTRLPWSRTRSRHHHNITIIRDLCAQKPSCRLREQE